MPLAETPAQVPWLRVPPVSFAFVLILVLVVSCGGIFTRLRAEVVAIQDGLEGTWITYVVPRSVRFFAILMWIDLRNILMVTAGWWNDVLENAYAASELAVVFDDDPDDDDNQHETIAGIIGASRSLVWMCLPGGAVLAKFGEASNTPVYLDFSERLVLQTPESERKWRYWLQIARYMCELALSLSGSVSAAALLLFVVTCAWLYASFLELEKVYYGHEDYMVELTA